MLDKSEKYVQDDRRARLKTRWERTEQGAEFFVHNIFCFQNPQISVQQVLRLGTRLECARYTKKNERREKRVVSGRDKKAFESYDRNEEENFLTGIWCRPVRCRWANAPTPNLIDFVVNFMGRLTENTMRKKGLKWSSIKYPSHTRDSLR